MMCESVFSPSPNGVWTVPVMTAFPHVQTADVDEAEGRRRQNDTHHCFSLVTNSHLQVHKIHCQPPLGIFNSVLTFDKAFHSHQTFSIDHKSF